jgi:acyl carrier protein
MTTEQIYSQLTQVFRNVFDDDTITLTPTTTAADIPEWDSLSHTNLIATTESVFKIKFRTAELESLRNVGHFVEVISSKAA